MRVDTAAYAEGIIPPYYDSLIAKLIVRGKDRAEAISRMARALGNVHRGRHLHDDPAAPQNSCRSRFPRREIGYHVY